MDVLVNQEVLVSVVCLVLTVKTANLDLKEHKVFQDLWDLLESADFRVKMVKTEIQDRLVNLDPVVTPVKMVLAVLKVLLVLPVLTEDVVPLVRAVVADSKDCPVLLVLLVTLVKTVKLVCKVLLVYLEQLVLVVPVVSLENVDLLGNPDLLDHVVLLV